MHQSGFVLLELLLSVAIITIIAGVSIPVYQSFQARNDLDIAAATFAQGLRRAQILSQAMDGDATWGVYVQNGSITLFRGATFALRDAIFDEEFSMPTSIAVSGIQEIVFSKFFGEPQTTGSLTLTSPNNEARTITTNVKGTVSY